jgi:uncharacterized OsmC-like protein
MIAQYRPNLLFYDRTLRMALKLKPKSFGPVFALFDGTETTRFAFGDPSNATPHVPIQTPVDTLLASLAFCIVKSVIWAADQQAATLQPFIVKVTGAKAPDLPGRVEKMHITIIGTLVEDGSFAEKIVKQAKSICTVSNTLNCDVTVSTEPAADA